MDNQAREALTKAYAGGCGTQLGVALGCGLTTLLVFLMIGCGLSAAIGITVNGVVTQVAEAKRPQPVMVAAAVAPDAPAPAPAPVAAEAPALNAVAQPEPTPLPPITTLPNTGGPETTLPPIVTATGGRVNVRTGPSTDYPRLGVLPTNASLPVIGRNSDASWWLVVSSEGSGWVFDGAVTASHVNETIPVVNFIAPAPGAGNAAAVQATPAPADIAPQPSGPVIIGTPTAQPVAQRLFVGETYGYKHLIKHLAGQPNTKNFAPRGDPILVAEGIQLHLVTGDGSRVKMLVDGNSTYRVWGDAVWSPDGEFIAFVIHYKGTRSVDGTIKCRPCRAVALYQMSTETMSILEPPNQLDAEAPRWTQDGRLLVVVHPGDVADGFVYEFNTAGQGKPAEGRYVLSTSHDGQMWTPWLPGRVWDLNLSTHPDSYYRD